MIARRRALALTSTSPRHSYFAARLAETFDVTLALAEEKKNYFTQARQESPEVEQHFQRLAEAEKELFPDVPAAAIKTVPDINAPEVVAKAKALKPDLVCLFGTSILKAPWLEAFPRRIVNLHLGLSPFYRGSATLFWPFYFQELECLGATIHLAEAKVDAGDILKRIKPLFKPGDSYYAATTRLIRNAIDAFPEAAAAYVSGDITPMPQEASPGRVMKKSDFNEAALSAALAFVGSGLTQEQINQAARSERCRCSP